MRQCSHEPVFVVYCVACCVQLYRGRVDTTGDIWAEYSQIWNDRPFEPDRALAKRVYETAGALRQHRLSREVVARVAHQLIPDIVFTSNAMEGSAVTYRETQQYVQLALKLEIRQRQTCANPNLPAIAQEMIGVMRGAELYAPLIPLHFARDDCARAEPPKFVTAPPPSSVDIPVSQRVPFTHEFLQRINGLLRGYDNGCDYRTDRAFFPGPLLLAPADGCHALMTRWIKSVNGMHSTNPLTLEPSCAHRSLVCSTEEEGRDDPITVAARAAWRLLLIHPWSDGNGRTARK